MSTKAVKKKVKRKAVPKKAGRKDMYEVKVKPYFKQIKEWSECGMIEKSIAKTLGVGPSTFADYKVRYPELKELMIKSRKPAITELENSLYESGLGGYKTIKKTVMKKTVEYKDGKRHKETQTPVQVEEVIYVPPNPTSGVFLLTNWDRKYSKDPNGNEIKKEELKLKKKQAEKDSW